MLVLGYAKLRCVPLENGSCKEGKRRWRLFWALLKLAGNVKNLVDGYLDTSPSYNDDSVS
jgi:hypothetical protein